jgi:hypothetical protein
VHGIKSGQVCARNSSYEEPDPRAAMAAGGSESITAIKKGATKKPE